MKLRIARRIVWSIKYNYGKRLAWNKQTILRALQHSAKWNKKQDKKCYFNFLKGER